ncbi:MAG: hypothetical protein KAT32_02915 [Candidatus Moranbacteria bacterium]|nr:hypothetical protein [Candidatus Moranbacteria bacterium]
MEEQKNANNKKKIFIIGGVILVVIILVGVFILTKNIKEEKAEELQRQEETRKEKTEEKKLKEDVEEEKIKEIKFPLGQNRYLEIDVPEGISVEQFKDTFVFKKDDVIFYFSFVVLKKDAKKDIKTNFNEFFEEEMKNNALEDKLTIKELEGDIFDGYYFMPVTDTKSKNKGGDYKYLAQAESFVEDRILISSYFDRKNSEENLDQWLEILKNIKIKQNENINYLESEDKKVRINIKSDTFKSDFKDGYLTGEDGEMKITLIINDKAKTKKECYSIFNKNIDSFSLNIDISDRKDYEKDNFLISEYLVKNIGKEKNTQKSIWKIKFIKNNCISININSFAEKDQKLFDDYLEKIEIVEN